MLGSEADLLECQSFEQVFAALKQGVAELAVVPIENSIVGEIVAVTELIKASQVSERERFSLEIDHILAGVRGARLEDISSVSSHPEAIKQCHQFLSARSDWSVKSDGDTASCVRRVAEAGSIQEAAIGSRRAAKIYGGEILADTVADSPENMTTFCLITNKH